MGKKQDQRREKKALQNYKNTIKPKLEALVDSYYQLPLIDPLGRGEDQRAIDTRLLDPKNRDLTDKIASRPPSVYYVIIGCGMAAICNHATLRQSNWGKTRIGGLPVMHIGHPDPWKSYFPHGMGQPPHLLRMPGFDTFPDPKVLCRGRTLSREFAAATEAEWNRLQNSVFGDMIFTVPGAALYVQQGTAKPAQSFFDAVGEIPGGGGVVAELQTVLGLPYPATLSPNANDPGKKHAPFRIAVVFPNGKAGLVYSRFVDICSGAGRPVVKGTLLEPRRAPPWIPAKNYWAGGGNSLMTANEALLAEIDWDEDDRYLCYGAGGVGLNMVERAEDSNLQLDWMAPNSLLGNGMVLRGNVCILRDGQTPEVEDWIDPSSPLALQVITVAGLNARDKNKTVADENSRKKEVMESRLLPYHKTIRFVRKAELASIVDKGDSPVTFTLKDTSGTIRVDYWGQAAAGPPHSVGVGGASPWFPYSADYLEQNAIDDADEAKAYDRFLLAIGQEQESPGTPKSMAGTLAFVAETVDGLNVAISAANGHVRVLGAAAQMFPDTEMKYLTPGTATQKYFAKLPASAVPPGFIYSGINIARANRFFEGRPLTNVNTMTTAELQSALGGLNVPRPDVVTDAIEIARNRDGQTGFGELKEVWDVARAALLPNELPALELAIQANLRQPRLSTSYPDAGPYTR